MTDGISFKFPDIFPVFCRSRVFEGAIFTEAARFIRKHLQDFFLMDYTKSINNIAFRFERKSSNGTKRIFFKKKKMCFLFLSSVFYFYFDFFFICYVHLSVCTCVEMRAQMFLFFFLGLAAFRSFCLFQLRHLSFLESVSDLFVTQKQVSYLL